MSEYRSRRATPGELKSCPFCGSADIANVSAHAAKPTNRWHAGDTIFAVNCRGCGASVPNRYRNDLVVDAWNRRTQSGEVAAILAHVEAQAAEIKRLRKLAMSTHLFEEAPCFLCGYNGPGYYQPEQHPCAALYHEAMEEQR